MGYSIHITRRASWSASDGASITEREWLAQMETDRTPPKELEIARRRMKEVT